MSYIDGTIIPVPTGNKDAYRAFAEKTVALFKGEGATRVVEGWGDDVPEGKVTDFRRAVQAEAGETVLFSWIEWPSKAVRDAAWAKLMSEGAMSGMESPFDGKRMIFGGFDVMLDA